MASMSQAELVEVISSLTLLEAAELTKALEEKLGVSAAAPVAVAAAPAAGAAAPAEEEKTAFNVELTSVNADANKVQVIKVVREVNSSLGLKEAKELVDGAPAVVKEGVSKEDGKAITEKFAAVGAKITLK